MDFCRELFAWPTVLWAGMICLIAVTLTVLTLTDNMRTPKWMVAIGNYFNLRHQPKSKRKTKHGK